MNGGIARLPRRAWLVIGLLVIAANLPYMVGALNAPEGGAFSGNAFAQTHVDYNSQLARMQHGLRGQWGMTLLFTPEEHPPQLVQPFYTGLGQFARLTGLSLVAVYHLGRLAGMILMWWAIWQFMARTLLEERLRWWAFLLATVVGGLGWVLYLIAPAQAADLAPIEFWLLDAYTLLAALTFPHFPFAVATLIGYALLLDRWLARPGWRLGLGLALLSAAIGLLQPFDLLLTALLTAVLAIFHWGRGQISIRQGLGLIPAAAVHAGLVIYYAAAFESHPVWRAFTAQNLTLSPPPIYYLLGYAWLLIPAGMGLAALWRARDGRLLLPRERLLLPVMWVLLVVLLVYAPLGMQRRFLMGVQVPLAALAALGLEDLRRRWAVRPTRWRLLMTGGLALAAVTHLLFILSAVMLANPEDRPQLFLDADALAAHDWLRDQPDDAVIFSTFETGGPVAGFTGRRVFIGHWIETMDFAAREAQTHAFFTAGAMTDAERLALLQAHGITHVWLDESSAALGAWLLEEAAFLRLAFESDAVRIYEVIP